MNHWKFSGNTQSLSHSFAPAYIQPKRWGLLLPMQEFVLHLLTPTPDGSKCRKILSSWSSVFLSHCNHYLHRHEFSRDSCHSMSIELPFQDVSKFVSCRHSGLFCCSPKDNNGRGCIKGIFISGLIDWKFKIYCSNFGNLYRTNCPASEKADWEIER
jgi:hypothetical protein